MAEPGLSPDASPVARGIYLRMRANGWTPAELTRRANLRPTFLKDIFSGKSQNPTHQYLIQIAAALGCSVDNLRDPGCPGEEPEKGHSVNKPDEIALVRFYRILSDKGKRRALERLADEAEAMIDKTKIDDDAS